MSGTTETVTATKTYTLSSDRQQQGAPSENKLKKASKLPVFSDVYEERKWAKAQMAGAFRVFAKLGYADGVAGHVSLRGRSRYFSFWR